ncbi:MAG: serine/threonine phosphatase [Leptolyngbya sp. SIOISBB]|nr:serine/threonine phosphatase [Leptolyngbya sp. SIOISBB]
MFVCPHCQFENPLQNRFCQQCGKALRELQAIILLTPGQESSPSAAIAVSPPPPSDLEADGSVDEAASLTAADLLTTRNQLKGEKRYQLRQPTDANKPLSCTETILSILDCEPATDSPLVQFLENAPDDLQAADIDKMIPPLAFPYWELQEPLYPVVPELQAAWQTPDHTVIVIEDRSNWRTLLDFAHESQVEPLELVHWLYEMLTLWTTLAPFAAESSLLESSNMRVDDDQVVCLQRLILNPSGASPTLQTLGQCWQTWMEQLSLPPIAALDDLVTDMAAGVLHDPAIVKMRLVEIADQLPETSAVAAAPLSPAEPLQNPVDLPEPRSSTPAESMSALDENIDCLEERVGDVDEVAPDADSPLLAVDDILLVAGLEETLEGAGATEASGEDGGLNELPTMALPMKLARLDQVGRTHVGRQRAHNEDSFFADTQIQRVDSPAGADLNARGLYILCDGMGGHSGGEVASDLAVTTLRDYFDEHWQAELPDEEVVRTGILQANQAIFDKNEAEDRAGNARMGTTLVMILVDNQNVMVAHVGDSRLYSFTRQGLMQTTVDHEVGQREIRRGVEPAIAYARPDAYQLTQALGPRSNDEIAPSIAQLTVNQDTIFLLCSDGLSDNDLLETHVESHLKPLMRTKTDLEAGVADLIDLANEHNGHDNITAIIVRVKLRPNLNVMSEAVADPTAT